MFELLDQHVRLKPILAPRIQPVRTMGVGMSQLLGPFDILLGTDWDHAQGGDIDAAELDHTHDLDHAHDYDPFEADAPIPLDGDDYYMPDPFRYDPHDYYPAVPFVNRYGVIHPYMVVAGNNVNPDHLHYDDHNPDFHDDNDYHDFRDDEYGYDDSDIIDDGYADTTTSSTQTPTTPHSDADSENDANSFVL